MGDVIPDRASATEWACLVTFLLGLWQIGEFVFWLWRWVTR